MNEPRNRRIAAGLPVEGARELRALFDQLFDEDLTPEQRERLNYILNESEAARLYYLQYVGVHSALTTTAGSHARASVDELIDQLEQTACDELAHAAVGLPSDRGVAGSIKPAGRFARYAAVLAATAALVAVGWFGIPSNVRDSEKTAKSKPSADASADVGAVASQVTYLSPAVRWQNSNLSFALESVVRAGQRLVLEQGQVELTYSSGAKLLLTGPSEFLVEAAGGDLIRGELVARVPKEGHGFTIDTPHGKVIDLGTEFGVVVDDFGVSQVNVYEGRVETLPTSTTSKPRGKIELTQGRALQLSRDAVVPMHARGGRYQRPGYQPGATQAAAQALTAIVDENFYDESLDGSFWKASGSVEQTDEGLRLDATREGAPIPRLVSRAEFDPASGPLRIVCELRFASVKSAQGASFAILTRAADEPSKPATPWQDILATCVRCSLTGNPGLGDGFLKVGAKFEADRELSNISWAGFAGLQPDATYRLEMCDDGLNVEFTVSQVANPAIRKTITCRSLFRGASNLIALEGSRGSTIIVERVRVLQQPVDQDGPSAVPSMNLAAGHSGAKAAVTSAGELIPAAGKVLLADDFHGSQLDDAAWSTLGSVAVVGGQVQLGRPNPDSHIDTWKARPYLLTRQEFDPARSPLTIVGRATFADNFLHGYGGSFAVMTRSDDRHGSGAGWENSILGRGVRSNFWPAALGQGRNVELFEKAPQVPISLLTAERFEINPRSRSYLFRVIDDGQSATLTLVDANNPAISVTSSHPTTAASQFGGRIAFEGCWGSPVLLDDIRIYSAAEPD